LSNTLSAYTQEKTVSSKRSIGLSIPDSGTPLGKKPRNWLSLKNLDPISIFKSGEQKVGTCEVYAVCILR
jgi:hypothetical protein